MRKSFKKGLAMVLAAAMAFSTPVAVGRTVAGAAETPTVITESTTQEDVVAKGAFNTSFSNYYKGSGNFEATFKVHMDEVGAENWNTEFLAITTDADRSAEGYVEYGYLRADQYNVTEATRPNTTITKEWFTADAESGIEAVADWPAWRAAMNGADEDITVRRIGDVFTVTRVLTAADGKKYSMVMRQVQEKAAEDVRMFMGADASAFTIKEYTYEKIEGVADGLLGDSIKAELNEAGTGIDLKYETKLPIDPENLTIKVNNAEVATGSAVSATPVSGAGTYAYTLQEDGEYKFTVSAAEQTIDGKFYLAQEKTVTVRVKKVGEKYLYDADLYEGFSVEEGSEGYNITWKALNEAAVKVTVTGDGKTITLDKPGTIKFADIKAGVKYTVTITAEKGNYVTKTDVKEFTYSTKFEPYTVGTTDKKTGFWKDGSFSKPYLINDKKTRVVDLEVHGGEKVYNNFVMVFANQEDFAEATRGAAYKEYAAVRTDLWGWGGGDNKSLSGDAITYVSHSLVSDGKTLKQGDADFEKAFIALMDSANANVEINLKVTSTKNAKNVFTSKTTLTLGSKDGKDNGLGKVYMRMVCDGSYFTVKNVTEKDYTGQIQQPNVNEPGTSTAKVSIKGNKVKVAMLLKISTCAVGWRFMATQPHTIRKTCQP